MSPRAYFNNLQENFTEMPSAKMQAFWNRRHFGSGSVLDTSPIAVINYSNKSHMTSSSQSMTGKTCQLEQEIPCHTKSPTRKQKAMNAILFAFFLFFFFQSGTPACQWNCPHLGWVSPTQIS